MKETINIRIASEEDAEEILKIYSYYVEETDITFEYDVPSESEFRERIKNTLKKYPYIVAEEDGKILGYAYAGTFHDRKAYDHSVETSIYVDKDLHKAGIGTLLYEELEKYLKMQNIVNVNACITYPNPVSEAFHKKHGYKIAGHFTKCGYKFGKWKDMIYMEKFLGEHKEKPEDVIWFSMLKL